MSKISHDHSVEHESFNSPGHNSPDAADDEPALKPAPRGFRYEEAAEHNVWDEPSFRAEGKSIPQGAQNYDRWYRENLQQTTLASSWAETLLLAISGGFFAFLTLFWGQSGYWGIASGLVVSPCLEEMGKIVVAAIVLETRPYLFRSPAQIIIAVLSSALFFALLQNALTLPTFIQNKAYGLMALQTCLSTFLHLCTTAIAGAGLVRMWSIAQAEHSASGEYTKPKMSNAFHFIVAAVILRSAANLLMMPISLLPVLL